MDTTGINTYITYNNISSETKQKSSPSADATVADKQTTGKEFRNVNDYKKYLTDKYECLRSKDYDVKINSSLLSKAMGDEKTREWLEYNLDLIPKCVEKTRAQAEARGAKLLSHTISFDGYDSMTAETCTQTEVDPGTEKTRKELQERMEKRREEKKAEEKKQAERNAEKQEEKIASMRHRGGPAKLEKKAMEEALTISVIGTDINEISEKTSESIIYGESGTVGLDIKA